jgi:hypothetical protein
LFNLDCEGPIGPYVVEDADFLAWYEGVIAGTDSGWFGERLPLAEPELVAVLNDDPSPARQARAGESLLHLPAISDSVWRALVSAMTGDADPIVRADLWDLLRWQRHNLQRPLDNAEAIADDIARYARSCTPPGLKVLGVLHKLTFTDVLPELACHDLERRRQAASQLVQGSGRFIRENLRQDLLDEMARRLLGDVDPLLLSHGVLTVWKIDLTHLHPKGPRPTPGFSTTSTCTFPTNRPRPGTTSRSQQRVSRLNNPF